MVVHFREHCLAALGLPDIFCAVKAKENTAALQLLPALVQELDSMTDPHAMWTTALQGVFAGNLFDLGSATSSAMFASGQVRVSVCVPLESSLLLLLQRTACVVCVDHRLQLSLFLKRSVQSTLFIFSNAPKLCDITTSTQASFHATRQRLKPRPWVIDDLDAAVAALADAARYDRHIVMLVDNAGSDVVLGILPLARLLLASRPGCVVVLAANTLPSINDVTANELHQVLDRAAAALGPQDVLATVCIVQGVWGGWTKLPP